MKKQKKKRLIIVKFARYTGGDSRFSKRSVKNLKRLVSTNAEKSVYRWMEIIVYRRTDCPYIYYFHFLSA